MTSAPRTHTEDTLAFDIAGGPTAGTVTLHRDGDFTYTAGHGAATDAPTGVDDTFEVTVSDGDGGVSTVPVGVAAGPSGLSSGMSLTVSDPDDTTGAVTVSVTVTGPESDPVVYLVVHDPSYGELAPGPSGGLIYTPNPQARAAAADCGPDSDQFDIAAYDSRGRSTTVPVSVEISPHASSVTAADSAAVASPDSAAASSPQPQTPGSAAGSWQLVHAAPGALIYAAPMTAAPSDAVRRARGGWQPSGSAAVQPHPGRSGEHSALDYAGYLGRAGLLAVALGVGAALARTPGVAWAEPTDTDSNTSSTSTSASTESETSSAQSGGSSTSTATRPGTASTDTSTRTTTTGAGPTVTVSSSGGAQTSSTATSETSATTSTSPSSTGSPSQTSASSPSQTSTTLSAPGSTSPPVVISSSGGAQTSTDTAPPQTPIAEAAPTVSAPTPQRPAAEPTAPADSVAPAPTTPAVTAPPTSAQEAPKAPVTDATPITTPEGRHTAPTTPSGTPDAPRVTPAAPEAAPSAAQPAGAPPRVPTVLSAPDTATTAADTTAPTGTAMPTAATADTTTAAAEAAAPSAAPAPVTPFPAVNRVISAVLSPLSAPTAAPAVTTAQTPVLFGVFSWIRRTFFNQTPTLAYDPTTTTQVDDTITGRVIATDADGPTPALSVTDAPDHGTVTVAADGQFTYTVTDPDYLANGGEDAFTITANDQASYPHIHGLSGLLNMITGGLIGSPGHTATTTMNVTVITNAPPVVDPEGPPPPGPPDQKTGAVTGSFGVVDPEDDPLTIEFAEGGAPAYGTVTWDDIDGTYTYTYTPNQAGHIRAGLDPDFEDSFKVNITQDDPPPSIKIIVTSTDSNTVSAIGAPAPTTQALTAAVAPAALTEDGFSQQVTMLGQATTEAEAAPSALNEDGFSEPVTIHIPIAPEQFVVDDPIEVPGTTGGGPAFVAVTADDVIPPRAYVTNVFDKVEVIDIDPASGTYNTVVDTIPTGASVLAVSPNGTHLYVISSGTSVSVIDTTTKRIIDIIPVDGPFQVVVTPDGTRAYVTASTSSGVSVIGTAPEDTLTYNKVITTIGVGNSPAGVAVSPNGTRAYVTNRDDGTVSVIGTDPEDTLTYNKVITTIGVGNSPLTVAVSPNPDVTRAYVVNAGDGTVSVIDTFSNTVIDTNPATLETDPIAVGGDTLGVAVSPDGSLAYVTSYNNHTLSVIDTGTNTVIDELNPVGGSLLGVAVTPDGNHIYVANPGGEQGKVGVISIGPTTPAEGFSPNGGDSAADVDTADASVAGDAAATVGVSEHTGSLASESLPVTQPDAVRGSTLRAGAGLTAAPTGAVTTTTYPSTTRTPVAVSTNTAFIEYVTGPGNLNETNTRFNIGGADLGIMWDNGIQDDPTTTVSEHQVLIAFGDTFSNSYPVRTGLWRMNTLLRTPDNTLSNGMYVPNTAPGDIYSGSSTIGPYDPKEIVDRNNIAGYAVGPEVTIIPTAGISVPGAGVDGATRQYVNFMSVRSWDTAGRWTTNYSGIAYSDDNGQTWQVAPSSIRPSAAGYSTMPFVSGNQNFQQGAYVKGVVKDASGNAVYDPATGQLKTDGYVYSYGTPAGRGGTVYLSRVKEADILDQTKYEYWNGTTKTWVANKPSAATPILPGTTSGWFVRTTTYPSVGEMSVQYNEYEKKYLMLYTDQNNNVVMRKANNPQGPWSAPKILVKSARMPGLYAPMIHPWSSTQNVPTSERHYLYWNMSTWGDYEVRLMRTDLDKV